MKIETDKFILSASDEGYPYFISISDKKGCISFTHHDLLALIHALDLARRNIKYNVMKFSERDIELL